MQGYKVNLGEPFEKVEVNVYDIQTKQIVFSGSQIDAAHFIGTSRQNVKQAVCRKSVIKKKYAVRYKPQPK